MSLQARIESLKERHAGVDARLTAETIRPRPDDEAVLKLKREKLRLKEEMARLQEQPGRA